jgi:hypothetical protein
MMGAALGKGDMESMHQSVKRLAELVDRAHTYVAEVEVRRRAAAWRMPPPVLWTAQDSSASCCPGQRWGSNGQGAGPADMMHATPPATAMLQDPAHCSCCSCCRDCSRHRLRL